MAINCSCGCGEEIPANQLFRYKAPFMLRGHGTVNRCTCGCNEVIPFKEHHRYSPPKRLPGHVTPAQREGFKRHSEQFQARPKPTGKPCECGCGGTTAYYHGRVSRFLPGHNAPRRGKTHTEEAKAKIRSARAKQENVSGIRPHGQSSTPTYKSWRSMLWRCGDKRDISYPRYGGRGITVCDRWNPKAGGSFVNFLEDMGNRPEGMTLDRIDGNGNYEPENCRWATRELQNANRPPDNGWNKRRQKKAH